MSKSEPKQQEEDLGMQVPKNLGKTRRIYPVIEGIQSNQTRIVYERVFRHFLDFVDLCDNGGVSLDYRQKQKILVKCDQKVIKDSIVDYMIFLRDKKGLGKASIKVHLSAILRFFQINNDDFNLTIRNFRLHMPSNDFAKDKDRHYTTEEIAQVLEKCDERSKVIVLLMTSTGMRIGALNDLKIGHLEKVQLANANSYKVKVYSGSNDGYITFCTPECAKAIQEYFEYRRRNGEELNDKSPLIRDQFDVDDIFRVQSPKPVTQRAIEYAVMNALERSGVRSKEVHLTHGFRKFFMTTCERASMRSINVKMLLGHDIGVSGHYYRPTESELVEDYMKAADALTIDPNKRLQQKVQQLEGQQTEEIERLKTQLQGYKEELTLSKQYHDTSKLSIKELEARLNATEDKNERAIRACAWMQEFFMKNKKKFKGLEG